MIAFMVMFISNQIKLNRAKVKLKLIINPSKKSWYLVYFKQKPQFQYLKEIGIDVSEMKLHTVIGDHYLIYLYPEQIALLNKNFNVSMHLVEFKDKIIGKIDFKKSKDFIGYFHSSFNQHNYNFQDIKKISKNFYRFKISDLELVKNISELLFIEEEKKNYFHNRWSSGYIQNNNLPKMNNDGFYTPRYLQEKGIDGKGQIITISDTGLDINSPYFYDKGFKFDQINSQHRKVIYYESYSDSKDENSHGTHVCGIAAGNNMCNNNLSLYNGIAPAALINFIDIGYSGNSIVFYPPSLLTDSMKRVKSYISSSSWGTRSLFPQQSFMFDVVSYSNPYLLFIFSAGNFGCENSINSPADAKNVLTVGSIDTYFNMLYESEFYDIILEGTGSNSKIKLNLKELPNGKKIININKGIVNKELSLKPDSDKILLVEDNSLLCSLQTNPIAALVTDEKITCTDLDFPVLFVNTFAEIKKTNKISITLNLKSPASNPDVGMYSSKGPTSDGIIKPDVVAPGSYILSANIMNNKKIEDMCKNLKNNKLIIKSGTSMSTPLVAGGAALIRQYFDEGYYPTGIKNNKNIVKITANLLRALIIASTEPLNPKQKAPNCNSGYGIVNLSNILTFSNNIKVFDSIEIDTNSEYVIKFEVKKNTNYQKLRIAMAFYDRPIITCTHSLNIDIDMYLLKPNGEAIFGNHHEDNIEEHFLTTEKNITISK